MFGKKKPSIFDVDQDKQLQALTRNQATLLKNNRTFDKYLNDDFNKIAALKQRVASLEKRLTENEQRDSERAKMFEALAAASKQVKTNE